MNTHAPQAFTTFTAMGPPAYGLLTQSVHSLDPRGINRVPKCRPERHRYKVRWQLPDIIGAAIMVDRTKNPQPAARPKRPPAEPVENLTLILSQKVVGQPAATRVIVPYIQMFQAGLAPEGRPVGVFLLLGPTGTE